MTRPWRPDCPTCGDNRTVLAEGGRDYFCTFCNRCFDDEPADCRSSPPQRIERHVEDWDGRKADRRLRRMRKRRR